MNESRSPKPMLFAHAGVAGRYRLSTKKDLGCVDANTGIWLPGKEIVTNEVPWFPNLITNLGMDMIGDTSGYLDFCHVGEGTTVESTGDTTLVDFLAGKQRDGNVAVSYNGTRGSAPYYGFGVRHTRFNPGEATGNISEVGISNQSAAGNLFSRSLVKDTGGTPTTISVLSDEYLDVDYEFRIYPAYVSADLDSSVGGTGFILRAASATTHGFMGTTIGSVAGINSTPSIATGYNKDAVVGTVEQRPQNFTDSDNINAENGSATDYVDGSHYRDLTYTFGPDDAVFNEGGSDGIKAVAFNTTMGSYQIVFDSLQAKTNLNVASLTVRLAWSRATI